MNRITRLNSVINVDVKFFYPNQLKSISYDMIHSSKFPDIQSSFHFPPKSIEYILELLFSENFQELNFFDITRMLSQLERGFLKDRIKDRDVFSLLLQKLFDNSEKYIKRAISKVIAKIYYKKTNLFYYELYTNLHSKEFQFIKMCLEANMPRIHQVVANSSFTDTLKSYGIYGVFPELKYVYYNYLLNNLKKTTMSSSNYECYQNNLLIDSNLNEIDTQVNILLQYLENKETNSTTKVFIEKLISSKLGDISDLKSNWHKWGISELHLNRFKRIKGAFEFDRFMKIATYLSEYTDLKESNLSTNGNTSDATRIFNRSMFWSNYDERFKSVEMWVSENDYKVLQNSQIDLSRVKLLKDINNEMCVFYFENMTIINFFRQDNINNKTKQNKSRKKFDTLVFIDENLNYVNRVLLETRQYSIDINNDLYDKAKYIIKYTPHWQGWVDEFLTKHNIYPNELILHGGKFKISDRSQAVYHKEKGLEKQRRKALEDENAIKYESTIRVME